MATYKEACEALGLLEGDGEWSACLAEAASFKTATAFRELFMLIMLQCSPTNPVQLLQRFKADLCDGCERRLIRDHGIRTPTREQIWDLARTDLQRIAERSGSSMDDIFGPGYSPTGTLGDNTMSSVMAEERSYDLDYLSTASEARYDLANEDQKHAVDAVMASVMQGEGHLFFLDGPGGTGKTFVEWLCLAKTRAAGKVALAVASSGVAALLLPGGRTAHSRFKIPIDLNDDSTCNVQKQSDLAELFRHTDLIVWDEAVMQHRDCFAYVDRMLRDIRDDHRLFGGITVLFAGDLRQCLPVIEKGTRSQAVDATITQSPFWHSTTVLHLRINMRLRDAAAPEQIAFARFLLEVGDGKIPIEDGNISLPEHLCLPEGSLWEDLVARVFVDIDAVRPTHFRECQEFFCDRVILAALNASVDRLNALVLGSFPGNTETLSSADMAFRDDGTEDPEFPTEFLNTLLFPGFPAHRLDVKVSHKIRFPADLGTDRKSYCPASEFVS